MARKSKAVETQDNQGAELIKAFVTLETFGVNQDDPVSTEDFALEMGVTPAEAFNLLDKLADAELVDSVGRGLNAAWWIDVPDVSATNAESIAREALANATPAVKEEPRKLTAKEQDYADRTAYAAAVSASQEEGAQHLHPMPDARPVAAAVEPVKASDGTTVTVPVDFDDPSKGRKELDASKGERLIAEDVITVRSVPAESDKGLAQFMDAETGDMVYESSIVKQGLALDEPASVPPCPPGVNFNIWDLAHTAVTQSARDYWQRRVTDILSEYAENNGQPAPF